MQGLKISVVIPAYNAARFLPRALASVFAQTLPPQEIIVADDGSTDGTAEVAAQLGVKVVRQANRGVSAARNLGVQHAQGEWIAFLDADDTWGPEKLARQATLVRPGVVLVYTGIKYRFDNGACHAVQAWDPRTVAKRLRYANPLSSSSVLVARTALLEVGGFRETVKTCEDWEMWLRLTRFGAFDAVADPLTDYRLGAGSLSSQPEKMLDGLRAILEPTLLVGERGWSRWTMRRRIWAEQLRSAALIARDNHLPGELRYWMRSLLNWPSPFWQPQRFACLAVTLRNSLWRGRAERL